MRQHRTASRHGSERAEAAEGRSVGKTTLTESLSAGEPLPPQQRTEFEGSLGRDLSHVRVHTDDSAARVVNLFGARAFAAGKDIAFAKGEYEPHSKDGKHLLAHEVAHTAQQVGAASIGELAPAGELATTTPGDAAESD